YGDHGYLTSVQRGTVVESYEYELENPSGEHACNGAANPYESLLTRSTPSEYPTRTGQGGAPPGGYDVEVSNPSGGHGPQGSGGQQGLVAYESSGGSDGTSTGGT